MYKTVTLATLFLSLLVFMACNQSQDFAKIQSQATGNKLDMHKFDSIKIDSLPQK